MKKSALLLVFGLILCSFVAESQVRETFYGVRGGMVLSGLDFDDPVDFDNDNRVGFFFGGFIDFGISDKFSIMTEVQYSAEGAQDEPYQIDFIQIPVQLRYGLSNDVRLGLGPQFGFITWDNQELFAQYAFSLVGSIELMITDMLFVDVRYNYGMSNVLEQPNPDNEKAYNRSFQIGLGLKL